MIIKKKKKKKVDFLVKLKYFLINNKNNLL